MKTSKATPHRVRLFLQVVIFSELELSTFRSTKDFVDIHVRMSCVHLATWYPVFAWEASNRIIPVHFCEIGPTGVHDRSISIWPVIWALAIAASNLLVTWTIAISSVRFDLLPDGAQSILIYAERGNGVIKIPSCFPALVQSIDLVVTFASPVDIGAKVTTR